MSKKVKVLYIGTTAYKSNQLDGETIKCRLLHQYLNEQDNLKVKCIDTENWKKHILKLVFLIIINLFWCDKIVVSASYRGSYIILNFLRKIKTKKEIYYFVIGGTLYTNIKSRGWNIDTYKRIKEIYVEAKELKDNLNELGINNVTIINNFKKISKFQNKYKKSEIVRFVFFGRVIKEKGIEQSIELIKRLNKDDNIKCTLDIYGQVKDDYYDEIKHKFDKNIKYKGIIEPNGKKEYELLSKYDIFILPTEFYGECLPGALIESYIAGLAVLVSNWTYAKEYVLDNKNGKIFEYKNYEDMYLKAKEMINNNEISRMKKESKKLSKKYSIDELLKDFNKKISSNEVK